MGTDQNGDESGKRMVTGGDTLLWRSGICAGKDTGINRSMIRFGLCGTDVHRTLCPRQGARGLLMDGTAVESAFALLLTKVTKEGLVPDTSRTTNVREGSEILYPAKNTYKFQTWRIYRFCAISGTVFERKVKKNDDEKNNKWKKWKRFSGA